MPPTLPSALTLSTIGLASKAFLRLACKDVRVEGLERLLTALEEPSADGSGSKGEPSWKGKEKERVGTGEELAELLDEMERFPKGRRRGLVTDVGRNAALGVLALFRERSADKSNVQVDTRGDIMFTKKLHSKFFTLGQVIETIRGGGVFQPAIDEAVQKLQDGEWIHIFPEGRVNQESLYPPGGLIRFKWGVARIIMDSQVMPTVIPIWLSGFDDIMPDTRKYLRFFPRPGKSASITIGQPITQRLVPLVDRWRGIVTAQGQAHHRPLGVGGEWGAEGRTGHIPTDARRESRHAMDAGSVAEQARGQAERQRREAGDVAGGEEERIRIAMCDVMYDELTTLGKEVEVREGKDKRPWRNAVARTS